MSLLLIMLFSVVAVVWVISIVDIIRQPYSAGTKAAWLAMVVLLPLLGSIIYTLSRKSTRRDAEQAYLAETDRRHSAGSRGFDNTGMGL
jgi:hypothetical protein